MKLINTLKLSFITLAIIWVGIRIILIYVIRFFYYYTKKRSKRNNFNWKLRIDWKSEPLLVFVLSIIVALGLVFSNNTLSISNQILQLIAFFIILNSYMFLIHPYIHSIISRKYEENIKNRELKKWILDTFGKDIRLLTKNGRVANAYASGVLPFTKTILLGKLLLEKMDDKEIKCIVLHELGHVEENHLFILFIAAIVNSIIVVFCLIWAWGHILPIFRVINLDYIGIFLIVGVLQFLLKGWEQRFLEYRADLYAAERSGTKAYLEALTKLHGIIGNKRNILNIDHPPLKKRIDYVEKHCN